MPAPRLVLRSAVLTVAALAALRGDSKKSVEDQRIELLRGLTAEWATVKTYLPRSKKPLEFDSSGAWDQQKWQDIGKELGPAARTGELIQVTRVGIEKDAIVLELNHGTKSGGHWYDHVQVGMGGSTNPVGNPGANVAANGTTIAVRFAKGIGDVTSADVKKMLKPV